MAGRRGKKKVDPAELSEQEQNQMARDIVTRQLAMMDRSRAQLAATLERKGIPEVVADEVLSRYEELGLIDDVHFAEALTRTRFNQKGASRRAIAAELQKKGVDRDIIEEATSQIDPDAELEAAVELASKKLRSGGGNPDTLERRAYALLARRGFGAGVCGTALRAAQDRVRAEQEDEA